METLPFILYTSCWLKFCNMYYFFCSCERTTFNICHLNILCPSLIRTTCAMIPCLIFSSELSLHNEVLRVVSLTLSHHWKRIPFKRSRSVGTIMPTFLRWAKIEQVDTRWPSPWKNQCRSQPGLPSQLGSSHSRHFPHCAGVNFQSWAVV